MTKASRVIHRQTRPTLWTRLGNIVSRISRKSKTLRVVARFGFGGPVWSTNDIKSFAEEGYQGNPYMFAAMQFITRGLAEAPPVLYRIKKGGELEKRYKAAHGMEAKMRGVRERRLSKNEFVRREIMSRAKRIASVHDSSPGRSTLKSATLTNRVARSIAMKQLAIDGEIEEVTSSPVFDILRRPNPWYQTTFQSYVEAWGLSYLLGGEVFTEPSGTTVDGAPVELYILPVGHMSPLTPTEENPLPGFRFSSGSFFGGREKYTFSPDPLETEIFFDKSYNPTNPLRGMSIVEPMVRSVDLNNEARALNLAFMKNAGVPPGMITGEFDPTGADAIVESYQEGTTGSNVGRVFAVSGKNINYHRLGVDHTRLQWGDLLSMTAKEIAIVSGLAPEILGDSANKTYANYSEARLSAYQDRILPLADVMYSSWNSTWLQRFGDDLLLDYDSTQILAIADDIMKMYDRLNSATFLTINEKRAAALFDDIDGGDDLYIGINQIPISAASIPRDDANKHRELIEQIMAEIEEGDGNAA